MTTSYWLPNYDTPHHFFRTIFESDAKVMRQWRSGESKDSYVCENQNWQKF